VNVTTTNLAASGSSGLFTYNTSLTATGTIDLTTQASASAALANLDSDINRVSTTRSTFGAVQNRFEAVISNLQNYVTNLSASRSRILDADFAAETANLTRAQILQQAGTAILSQANAVPQSALSLLR
jgi:flagellin